MARRLQRVTLSTTANRSTIVSPLQRPNLDDMQTIVDCGLRQSQQRLGGGQHIPRQPIGCDQVHVRFRFVFAVVNIRPCTLKPCRVLDRDGRNRSDESARNHTRPPHSFYANNRGEAVGELNGRFLDNNRYRLGQQQYIEGMNVSRKEGMRNRKSARSQGVPIRRRANARNWLSVNHRVELCAKVARRNV